MDEIITMRGANVSDCGDLAKLDNIASHGLSFWFWQNDEELLGNEDLKHKSALEIGIQRMANPQSQYGFTNAVMAQVNEEIAGFATGFVWSKTDDVSTKDQNPVILPVVELFSQCEGGWWLDGLAVYPEFRNRGLGGKLLDDCFSRAKKCGSGRVCLAAEDSNVDALKLYQSRGFVERDRRQYIPFKTGSMTKYWLLMEAKVS